MESSKYSDKILRKQILEENQVIVRIWTSQANPHVPGENVGHVSIETPEIYLSFWPTKDGKSTGKGVVKPIEYDKTKRSYDDDFEDERRAPELIFHFYTLDVDQIKTTFNHLCSSTEGWSLTGLALLGGGDSCASSAWKLLVAGKIENLISKSEQISASSGKQSRLSSLWFKRPHQSETQQALRQTTQGSSYATEMAVSLWIKSPDFIGKILEKAKSRELEIEPLTENIDSEKETSELSPRSSQS
jgi:hypothetical protein